MRVWDVLRSEVALSVEGLGKALTCMQWAGSDNSTLCVGVDERVVVLEVPSGRVKGSFVAADKVVALSCDGQTIFVAAGRTVYRLGHSKDGLALEDQATHEERVNSLDAKSGQLAVALEAHIVLSGSLSIQAESTAIAFYSRALLLSHTDTTISLWSTSDGQLLGSITSIKPIVFVHSAPGRVLAGLADGTIAVYDTSMVGQPLFASEAPCRVTVDESSAISFLPAMPSVEGQPEKDTATKSLESNIIAVFAACLFVGDTGPYLLAARGLDLRPDFESLPVPLKDTAFTRSFDPNVFFSTSSILFQHKKRSATVIVDREVDFIRGNSVLARYTSADLLAEDFIHDPSASDDLEEEAVGQTEDECSLKLTELLSQAIRAGDKSLLEHVIASSDGVLIHRTLRQLDTSLVPDLLRLLVSRLSTTTKPGRLSQLTPWLQGLLKIHRQVLFALPDIQTRLAPMFDVVDERLAVQETLIKLQQRLGVFLQHVDKASATLADEPNEDNRPVVVFNDEL